MRGLCDFRRTTDSSGSALNQPDSKEDLHVHEVSRFAGRSRRHVRRCNNPNESYTVDGLNIFGATINASDITITNTAPASNGITAYGDFKLNAANDISIQGTQNGIFTPDDHANPSITIKTPKKLTITGPWAIHAEGEGKITIDAGDLVLRGSNGIAANSTGTVSIDAQTVDIACTNKYGVSSANTGGVTIKAEKSIYIKGGSANAVNGLQGAIKLESNGTTVVDGDILARAATVSADFKGAGSSLTGAVTTGDTGTTKLGFSDGALWKAEGDSKVSELTLKGGVVDLNNHNVTAKQLAENSAATIRLDAGAETLGSFTVGNQDVKADLNVDLVQNADVVDEALAKQALAQIQTGDNTTVEAHVKEGLVNPDITFNKDGSTASVGTNTLIRDTLDLAAASSLSLNRILMNDVRKRMGDLRSSSGKNGVWARYDGGRLESDAGLKNDFNTFQTGFDTMPLDNGVRFGVAASYTWSDTDFARGEADMDAFGLAAYGVWMGDNGMFADVVARVAKASNDMTIDSVYKGDLDTVTTSLSGEFGWRFDLARTVWIEPQIEATYTHAGAEDLTLSNGVNAATYEIGDFDSLIGRAGFATGFTCPNNRGEVWLRASAVHEFLGDREIFARTGDNTNSLKQDGKDTWFEYGIGANFNLSESTYLWADVERTSVGSSQRRLIFVSIQAACTKRSSTPSESKVFIQTASVRIQASQASRSGPSCLTVSTNWRLCDSLCERSHFGPPSSSLRTGSGVVKWSALSS